MRKIYILHQYYDKSHFKALYDSAEKFGYIVEDFFVLDNFYIIKNIIKKIIFRKKLGLTLLEGIHLFLNRKKLKHFSDELLIVGLAPYDSLLFRYNEIIKKNISIYFSSWQIWDGSSFPRGKLEHKEKWENILRNSFNGAACVSKHTYNQIKKFIPKATVVKHAISYENYVKKNHTLLNHKFLFFGRFENSKNIKYIIKWIKENPSLNIKFDFAGFGSYQKEIEDLSKLDIRVNYLGILDKKTIQAILHQYDFTLLPSKIEPFGISLLESLAAGTPCITSNASGPSEIIIDNYNGIVCDANSYISFRNAMSKAITISPLEYKYLCDNAKISGKEYSSDHIAKLWCELFDLQYKN